MDIRPDAKKGKGSLHALGDILWRHGECVSFWALALLHLIPIWGFRYVPTQDGPSHVFNAQVLVELGRSNPRYEEFFEVRAEPIPNWTSHVVLAGLLYIVPPLVAEKLLVSLYILGFAGGFRYFVGAFGPRAKPISWLGLLFVFNRCLWMGFYNYCLSLIFVWLIVGYCIRRRADFVILHTAILTFLLGAAYFTHLVGFVVAVAGALGAAILLRPWSVLRPILVALATAPWLFLLFDYFEQTRFFESGAGDRLMEQPLWRNGGLNVRFDYHMRTLEENLFGHQVAVTQAKDLDGKSLSPGYYLTVLFLCCAGVSIAATLWRWLRRFLPKGDLPYAQIELNEQVPPGWYYACMFGLLMFACYVTVVDHLPTGGRNLNHGGFLKCRLALYPPLILLACLREPAFWPIRLAFRGCMAFLLCVNLVVATDAIEDQNRILDRYTAGIEAAGRGRRMLANDATGGTRFADPLLHADDYYCLGTDNLNIRNYEADTPHFPIKFRPGARRGRNGDAELRIYWGAFPSLGPPEWEAVFDRPPLRIYVRTR